MLSNLFLGMSLLGAEWVLYLLVLISILSIGIIIERFLFYREATHGLSAFRSNLRTAIKAKDWNAATKAAQERLRQKERSRAPDFETALSAAILDHQAAHASPPSVDILSEIAQDALLTTRLTWEKHLAILATIGSNAPFVGLFGTVLGIIQAFHELSQKSGTGVQGVTAGISDALIATAVGILVAIPAVVAFNLFQRKVKAALGEADALKSFLVGKIAGGNR